MATRLGGERHVNLEVGMRSVAKPWWRALFVFLLIGGVGLPTLRGVSGDERPHGQAGQHEEKGGAPGDTEKKGHADEGMKQHAAQGRRGGPLEEQGRQLVVQLHCNACHLVSKEIKHEHQGGHMAVAPDLAFEGDKVRPEWLFDFLKGPHRIRPWLDARMPTFQLTDREALALTEHFVTDLRNRTLPPLPGRFRYRTRNPEENIRAGARLVSEDYLDCFKCHQAGDRKPPGPPEEWAPDLALARSRLRPEWIVWWLMEPQENPTGNEDAFLFHRRRLRA